MKNKKVLALLLAGSFALTGCGGANQNTEEPAKVEEAAEEKVARAESLEEEPRYGTPVKMVLTVTFV